MSLKTVRRECREKIGDRGLRPTAKFVRTVYDICHKTGMDPHVIVNTFRKPHTSEDTPARLYDFMEAFMPRVPRGNKRQVDKTLICAMQILITLMLLGTGRANPVLGGMYTDRQPHRLLERPKPRKRKRTTLTGSHQSVTSILSAHSDVLNDAEKEVLEKANALITKKSKQ